MSRDADFRAALALFERLRELDPAARDEALAEAAPPAPVRALLLRLLSADAVASPLLDAPPAIPTGIDEAPGPSEDDASGQRIGRWELTGLLGRGGMSVVYRARSLQPPLGQEAALKRLALPAPDAAAMARFEREMAILVRLRHPAIAPLLDAGIDAEGLPWFAMGLVEGEPIDRWAEARGLGTDGRLRLCLQACEAVAHAHRHLVVHRDIKPGNVLVDGEGRVVLLDFGISRVLEEGESAQTSSGSYAFTPRYAAPEQRAGGAVSTATDVYGLGALLHMLLLRQPVDLPEGEDAPRLPQGMPSDLAAILRRALARDPARRYPSAEALAADIDACLAGRPVQARRGGAGYRLRRFVGRHRAASALALALAASLVLGTMASLHQASLAREEAARARAAEAASVQALSRAETLNRLLLDMFEAERPERPRSELPSTRELLDRGLERARDPDAGDPRVRASLLVAIGEILQLRGRTDEAAALGAEATALLDGALGDAGNDAVDERIDALLLEASALRQLGRDGDAALRVDTAETLLQAARPDPARQARLLGARIDQAYGIGDYVEVLARAEALMALVEAWPGAGDDDRLRAHADLALGLMTQRRHAEAVSHFDAVIAHRRRQAGEGSLAVARSQANAATNDLYLGEFARARARLDSALATYDQLFDAPAPIRATGRLILSMLLTRQGQFEAAAEALSASMEEYAPTVGHPDGTWAMAPYHHALLHAAAGRHAEAEAAAAASLRLMLEDPDGYPADQPAMRALLARLACRDGRLDRAREQWDALDAWVAAGRPIEALPAAWWTESRLLCASARGELAAAATHLPALREAALALSPGDQAEATRWQLTEADLLHRLDGTDPIPLSDRARAALRALGVDPGHPLLAADWSPHPERSGAD